PAPNRVLPVGLDQGYVDAVHRGAAHQADGAQQLAHDVPWGSLMDLLRGGFLVHVPPASRAPYPRSGFRSNRGLPSLATSKSDFPTVPNERGFIHQCSGFPGLDALAAKGQVVAYVGYDCTAPSLHIGHLYTMMMLYWLQQTGAGQPIALMGGGTTRVGDP